MALLLCPLLLLLILPKDIPLGYGPLAAHLLEAVWQHMPVLLVGTITNVGHGNGTLELPARHTT